MSLRNLLSKFSSSTKLLEDEYQPHVVIIGGGYGGLTVGRSLRRKNVRVTVISRIDYFFYTVRGLELCVPHDVADEDKFMPKLKSLLPHCRIVVGDAIRWSLHEKTVSYIPTMQSKDKSLGEISYDYLVIATGMQNMFPGKPPAFATKPEALSAFGKLGVCIKRAKSILVLGGGPTGIELVGELSSHYPSANLPRTKKLKHAKSITLMHNLERLLVSKTEDPQNIELETRLAEKVTKSLLARGCQVMCNETLKLSAPLDGAGYVDAPGAVYETVSGLTIQADVVVFAYGIDQNIDSFAKSLSTNASDYCEECNPVNITDESGFIKVSPTMQLDAACEQAKCVFVVGDCSNSDPAKQAYRAMDQAIVASKNILALAGATETTPPTLVEYVPKPPAMIVPLGGNVQYVQARNNVRKVPGILRKILDKKILG